MLYWPFNLNFNHVHNDPQFDAEFFDGSSLVSRCMMQMTACAVDARAPFSISKAQKLVFYQTIDKETFVKELEILKQAVADQAYYFQLHKVHIHNLRVQH